MRILGGDLGGLRFYPPADKWPTRPTTDISKEALYNILMNRVDFEDLCILDLFGGTGNHCFECLSRGCAHATYVDRHVPAIKFVQRQAKEWSLTDRLTVIRMDVKKFIQTSTDSFDYIFAGPPYPLPWLDEIPALVFNSELLHPQGLFVLEHNHDHNFSYLIQCVEERRYGQTHFSFFKHVDMPE